MTGADAGAALAGADGWAALALAWAAVVLVAAARRRPPARVRALAPPAPSPGTRPRLAASGSPVGRRRAERRRLAAVRADLPEVVDLLRMCVGAGLTVPLAVAAVARRADGPVARALGQAAVDAANRGRHLADELDRVPEALGDDVRPLATVLAASERYGHAIAPALERLATECRADQRRRAEAAARRVPVLLLFPLVTCILPAFALLTVAPLLAGALRALRL